MSGSREKKRRTAIREDYNDQMARWYMKEPPKIFFISHKRWKKSEPQLNLKADIDVSKTAIHYWYFW